MRNKISKEFDKKGFVIVKNLLSKSEIKLIYSQLNSVINTIIKSHKFNISKNKNLDYKYLFLKRKNPEVKSRFYNMLKYLDSLSSLSSSKKILNIIKYLLNSKTVFMFGQRFRLDHSEDQNNVPLHQELNNISNDFVLMWIPLVDVSKKTGTLCIIPESHKYGHLMYKDSKKVAQVHKVGIIKNIMNDKEKKNYNNPIVKKLFNKKRIHHVCLKPGDAIFFKPYLFHGSTPNVLKRIRWTFLATYHPIDKVPYLKDRKNKIRIPYNMDYNKL